MRIGRVAKIELFLYVNKIIPSKSILGLIYAILQPLGQWRFDRDFIDNINTHLTK